MALNDRAVDSFIASLPDPEGARAFWERLQSVCDIDYDKAPQLASRLLTIAAYSPFLAEYVLRHPDSVDWLWRETERGFDRLKTREQLSDELARFLMRTYDVDLRTGLARFKRRELLRIYLRDCLKIATLAEVTEELSHLADVILRHALTVASQEMSNRYGAPLSRDQRGRIQPSEFAIVALGKLGCSELNYASDIDLFFLFAGDGDTAGVGRQGESLVNNKEFFQGVAQRVTQLVAGNSPEGAAYRVDLRLRPYGRDGDLVWEIHRAADYYRTRAQNWERQALLRARAAAGNEAVVADFLDLVRDAIFTRDPRDYAMQEVRRAKEKIDREVAARGGGFNVKLGRGGIREIEFIAQALQLRHGGDEPWLRSAQTLIALARLTDKGYLSEIERARLSAAYTFLRTVEHRLQMEHGAQTHVLPVSGERLNLLARRCGYPPGDNRGIELQHNLETHTTQVRAIYHRVFGRVFGRVLGQDDQRLDAKSGESDAALRTETLIVTPEPLLREVDDENSRLVHHATSSMVRVARLMRAGPDGEANDAEGDGPEKTIEHAIVAALTECINPLRSLRNLAAWADSCATFLRDRRVASAVTLDLAGLIERLIRTLSSQYLANLLIARPLLADALFEDATGDVEAFCRRMQAAINEEAGPAARSDALRRVWDRQVIAIGYRDVIGVRGSRGEGGKGRRGEGEKGTGGAGELRENNLAQTALAEATVRLAVEIAFEALGMGRLREGAICAESASGTGEAGSKGMTSAAPPPDVPPDASPGSSPNASPSASPVAPECLSVMPGLPFTILGLGRLGHAGMDYGSDLDLLVVFDDAAAWPPPLLAAAGVLKSDELPQEFYARFTSEVVRVLASITREGLLYRVDLRLRPEGKNGPLACGLNALVTYLAQRASAWEHSAYLKAREVAGDRPFGALAVQAITAAVFDAAAGNPHLREELARMRERLEGEKARGARINVKWGPGGMTDVYFITRYLQLRERISFPPFAGTAALIAHLGARGVLDEDPTRILFDGYMYLRRLDHWMRLLLDRPTPEMPASDVALNDLARALGAASPRELLRELSDHMAAIRAAYQRVF